MINGIMCWFKSSHPHFTSQLQQLMQQVGISNYEELRKKSGVREREIIRLRYGLVLQTKAETLVKLAQTLQISVDKLIKVLSSKPIAQKAATPVDKTKLKQEYQRLQKQIANQKESLQQEFQQESLQTLESWLVQWPTAAAAVENNPELPATRLLPLIKPVTQLLQNWRVEAIASVGEEVAYNPQQHQLMSGTAQDGDPVKVRYLGYSWKNKLLYRAKVSPVGETGK
ncbi:MAG: helix-turn-helix transcriptional regulator [Spirulinaceae cyanobacterium]